MFVSQNAVMRSATVTTSSTIVLDINVRRRWAGIYNSSGNGVWLGFGAAALIGYGPYIPPGGSFEIDSENLFRGPVYAIVSTGTQAVGTVEFT